jgi:tetratricopeptide (TPR) repeat protein
MWKSWLVAGAIALTLVCLPVSGALAGAQENLARDQVKQATAAYNLGHFDEAAEHYEEAYRLVPDPVLLFNIAQSYRLGGKPDKALNAYRAFLRTADTEASNREVAEKHIAEIKRHLEENKGSPAEPVTTPPALPANPSLASPPPLPPQGVSPPVGMAGSPPQNPALPQAGPTDLSTSAQSDSGAAPQEVGRPFYKTWWFWTAVGGAVVAGTVTAFLVGRGSKNGCSGEPLTCVGIQ